jgi:hypothetical protein
MILTLGSIKWMFIQPSAETPIDTMRDLLKVGRVRKRWFAGMSLFLVWTGASMRSFFLLLRAAAVKSFSSVNQMKLTRLAGYNLKSWLEHWNLTCLLAFVSSWALRFFKHWSCKSLLILLTDDWLIPICLCVRYDCGISSWLSTSHSTCWTLLTVLAVLSGGRCLVDVEKIQFYRSLK